MTPEGRAGLTAVRSDPSRALVVLDYDGTLAPVVADPGRAHPAPGAVAALRQLQVGRLAVVTGRAADVAVRLGGLDAVPSLVVLGQYGAQRWEAGHLSSAGVPPGLAEAAAELARLLCGTGAALEDKGLSLSVHTRGAADPAGLLAALSGPVAEIARRAGLSVHPGRLVLEVRPAGFDKGQAVLTLAEPAPGAVCVVGDDVGDAPMYDAVRELRARGVPGVTVFADSAEGPAALRDAADLVVPGPDGVVAFLQTLAQAAPA